MRSFAALFLVLSSISLCRANDATPQTHLNILFIGNSYTRMTHGTLKAFVDACPETTIMRGYCLQDGQTLRGHYNNRFNGLIDELQKRDWDYVVLQEQSTTATETIGSPDYFMDACRDLKGVVDAHSPGATLAFFETWARRSDYYYFGEHYTPADMQRELRQSYLTICEELDGKFIPVGDAWEKAYGERPYPELNLHNSDASHPNTYGRYLTGAVFFEALYGRNSLDVDYTLGVGRRTGTFLREQAHEAVVPEPLTLTLCVTGFCAVLARRRR
jgi:hypothetical protein